MNELFHLKMFFKEFHLNRIIPIKHWMHYYFYLKWRLLFMTEEQREAFHQKRIEESREKLRKTLASFGNSFLFKEDEEGQ